MSQPDIALDNTFDYRIHQAIYVPIGLDLMTLSALVISHGNDFEEFMMDFTTVFRIQSHSFQEYLNFKNDVMYFGYLRIQPNEATLLQLGALLDAVHASFKQHLVMEKLFVGGRLDYEFKNHSNHGLLLAAR